MFVNFYSYQLAYANLNLTSVTSFVRKLISWFIAKVSFSYKLIYSNPI